jgi:formate hydrogenlyase subunit 3/multisubunit Na+/H+ antiporter MnhD subunit
LEKIPEIMMREVYIIIFLPVIVGIILYAVPRKYFTAKGIVASLVAAVSLYFSFRLYFTAGGMMNLSLGHRFFLQGSQLHDLLVQAESFTMLNVDSLAKLIVIFVALFTLLVSVYSIGYLLPRIRPRSFFTYVLITAGCSNGAVLADHMLLFIFFWGILGITLYKLIKGYNSVTAAAAKKTFILIGASDGIMILGLAIIWRLGYPLSISEMSVPTNSLISVIAFACLLIGAFTKAGAFPFHTWVPDYATFGSASSSAYMPASLDKLLGIYFLARLFNSMFVINDWITLVVLIIGVSTIIIAVMMALAQHDYKRLLGYHAVSQVGYMVTGFALGTPLGVAGGLFHMFNHALYKSGLFLSAGHIEKHTGKHNIDDLGGLSKIMPLTFFSAIIFALSISGIPPLNGFASKWLIYQGIIEFGQGSGIANQLWIIWLSLAMFGSALTLASFIKFLSGIFMGPLNPTYKTLQERNYYMCIPQLFLAIVCIGLGVFASGWVIPKVIQSVSGSFSYIGFWESSTVSLLVLISIILGLVFYLLLFKKNIRVEKPFILGEPADTTSRFHADEFFKTIFGNRILGSIYKAAEKKYFDIYEISRGTVLGFSKALSWLHAGVLPVYLIWIIAGLLVMFFIFL